MTIFSSYEWHLWKKLLICVVGSTGVIFIIKNIFKQQLLFGKKKKKKKKKKK